MSVAEVRLWGRTIGAVSWDTGAGFANFEYDPAFRTSGIQIAPLTMPLADRIYSFPGLSRESFHGLPGLLADSLPDDFGNAVIDAWLAREGRSRADFDPVQRLCYTGNRGMGALEYVPMQGPSATRSEAVDVAALVELAGEIMARRGELEGSLEPERREESLQQILQVGTSAGGARAKAIIAWNPDTNEVRSGQVPADEGFEQWILKFDGVGDPGDERLANPAGYGLIEYAYHKMAVAAGIDMAPCRLLEENGRHHFMTKRFDRDERGRKIHMLSLGAMAHLDYRQAGAYSYEQAMQVIRKLGMGMDQVEEMYRRMCFNIVARNQDDHVKNIGFLMDRGGRWRLAPAFDLTFAYNPDGPWTNRHQMSMNGKNDGFRVEDFRACAEMSGVMWRSALRILRQILVAVSNWEKSALASGLEVAESEKIRQIQRIDMCGLS